MKSYFNSQHKSQATLIKCVALILATLGITLLVVDRYTSNVVHQKFFDSNSMFSDVPRKLSEESIQKISSSASLIDDDLEAQIPFLEVDILDENALNWSNIYSNYSNGILVFDANSDGQLDIYVCQDGENWTRPTDSNGKLLNKARHQHNGLYIGNGKSSKGIPKYLPISNWPSENHKNLPKELLPENFLFPRESQGDSLNRTGRKCAVAVAADFDANGHLDLLIGNALPGIPWSTPETNSVLSTVWTPHDRASKKQRARLSPLGLSLIVYEPKDHTNLKRPSSRGQEYYGANTLLLNLGDQDGDGLPEWQDVSRTTGIEGKRSSHSFSVADIDLDGDLDIFVGNVMDMDFWPAGSKSWAGAANELYINQLAESGKLKFIEKAAPMGVDGVFNEKIERPSLLKIETFPFLPEKYSYAYGKLVPYSPPALEIKGEIGELAEISWASIFQDVNNDGYPDLWVANDLGNLRLFHNQQGKFFEDSKHAQTNVLGAWMSFAPGDFDLDGKEDLFVGNSGGSAYNVAYGTPKPSELTDPVTEIAAFLTMIPKGLYGTHTIFDGRSPLAELTPIVKHSKILPPDSSIPSNVHAARYLHGGGENFDLTGLDPYEFSWGSTIIDAQNDGRPDIYFHGSLYNRGGGLFSISGTNPGRLLVNSSKKDGTLRFVDLTAEHQLLNIEELSYKGLKDNGVISRPAPRINWKKRDVVLSTDRSALQGLGAKKTERIQIHDLTQTAEQGRAAIAADINNDGFSDLLLRNIGGYDSRSSTSVNLKLPDGKVLPSHDPNHPALTDYQPGRTRLFLNQYKQGNWIKVTLQDTTKGNYNRDAIGARVTVNNRFLKVKRVGDGSFVSNKMEPLLFGLASEVAKSIQITWPNQEKETSIIKLEGIKNRSLLIEKTNNGVKWRFDS